MRYGVVDETTDRIINWSRDYKLMFKFALFYAPAKYHHISIIRITRCGSKELWQYVLRLDDV